MQTWKIRPLHVGTLHRKRSNFLYMVGSPEPLDVPVTVFLLESGDTRVLVDTGCDDPETAFKDHHPFNRTPEQHPLEAIRRAGTDPESIQLVISTHLHWDHCYGNHLFPHALFVVQREELRYAAAPLPWHRTAYDSFLLGRTPPWASTRFDVVDGDVDLMDGLRLLLTPGHTPGLQSVLIDTAEGKFLLPSDNVPMYENWEGKGPNWPRIPDTHHYDLSDYYASFVKMEATGAPVIPPHDFRIFERPIYG